MFLPFLCLGTVLAPSCRTSCQATSSPPPSFGSVGAVSSHPFSRSMTAPMQSCTVSPAPSPSESGSGTRSSLSATSRLARLRTLRLAACVPAADCQIRTQAVLQQPSGSRFQTRWFLHLPSGAATRRSRNRFPTQRGGFCMPGTGGATDAVPVPSTGTATKVGPLTSSPPGRGQSSGGFLWTPAYTPGDGQTSWVYSTIPVLHLYISCYVPTVNKPVLSYLLLCLLLHYHPFCLDILLLF
jgi:hypothetical protein